MLISSCIKRGALSLPGADAASNAAMEQLLKRDHSEHHCYFRPGFHNHLLHHLFAAYDLGAPASLLHAIFYDEAKIQRPIDLKENGVVPKGIITPGQIKEDNWTNWLGDAHAYSAYVEFFSRRVEALGIVKTLEDYIFSSAANANGSFMLFRLFSGVLHPFIHIGYGLEFDTELQVAAGLASTAIHPAREEIYVFQEDFHQAVSSHKPSVDIKGRQPHTGPSILSLLRQIYDSPKLTPILPPYDPKVGVLPRLQDLVEHDKGSRIAELKRIMCQFEPGETFDALDSRVEELIFTSTLLTFGTGKRGRKPRVDFFLMHLLTSSIFVPAFFKYVPNLGNRKALLRTFLQPWWITVMIRGRPRIDPALLMSFTDHPIPPNTTHSTAHPSSIDGNNNKSVNPWSSIVADVLHAPDSHTIKSCRTLLYGATRYGTIPKGDVIGALGEDGKETHSGISQVDGTIFVRAAGILMDNLGWVTHGQQAGEWDRSGLGWENAWKNGD